MILEIIILEYIPLSLLAKFGSSQAILPDTVPLSAPLSITLKIRQTQNNVGVVIRHWLGIGMM